MKGQLRRIGIVLCGIGFAAFYFSIYSAFGLYHLCSSYTALGLAIFITAAAMILSIRLNLMMVALIGTFGGYLSPMLYATDYHFSRLNIYYILILSAGILVSARYCKWKAVNGLALVFHWLAFIVFSLIKDQVPLVPLALSFLLFSALPAVYLRWHNQKITALDLFFQLINTAIAVFLGSWHIEENTGSMALASLVPFIGAAYFAALLGWGLRQYKQERRLLFIYFVFSAGLLTTAMPMLFDRENTLFAWSVFATLLIWLAKKVNSQPIRWLGVILFIITGICVPIDLNAESRTLTQGVWAAAALASALLVPKKSWMQKCYGFVAVLAIFFYITGKTGDIFLKTPGNYYILSLVWGAYALILVGVGLKWSIRPLRITGLCLFILTILKLFSFDLSFVNFLIRAGALCLVGLALFAGAVFYIRSGGKILHTNDSSASTTKKELE